MKWPATEGSALPIIFFVLNNHYAMTGRSDNEVMGVSHVAQRAAGFADNRMHAEIINGMDVLATRDAVLRAAQGCREGQGPYFLRRRYLPLLWPLSERSSQRIPHP